MSGFTIVTKDSHFYERSLVYGVSRPRRCQVKIPGQGIILVYQISRYPADTEPLQEHTLC